MKKVLIMLCAVLTAVMLLTFSTFAAETVIYENDFSDPATLAHFQQYMMKWEIRDGGLYLTNELFPEVADTALEKAFAHILYKAEQPLTEYVVEVDYMNLQTAGGIVFNADIAAASHGINAFHGYLAFIANDGAKGALGCGNTDGGWKGNINVGSASAECKPGTNAHITVTVKGGKVKVDVTNKDTGAAIYSFLYTIGESASDVNWPAGTVGFRMRHSYTATGVNSVGTAYFDNLKITTANEVNLDNAEVVVPEVEYAIDTSKITTVYTNTFDTQDSLKEFKLYGGEWTVQDGKLYPTAVASKFTHMLYNGSQKLKGLTDYVLDVDMYNSQTQMGAIIRSDLGLASDGDNAICGYIGFLAFDGVKAALGYGNAEGGWGGNLLVGTAAFKPGSNLHLQVAVQGKTMQLVVTELETGKFLWTGSADDTTWASGTFGFRAYGLEKSGLMNLNNTAFDNLKISVFGDGADFNSGVEVMMTADKTDYTVNGAAKAMDVAPVLSGEKVMLPLRHVAQALGATVAWDGATSTATVKLADRDIKVVVGAATATVNGAEVTLDTPAYIAKDRTYMSIDFIAEALGAKADWNGDTFTASLLK